MPWVLTMVAAETKKRINRKLFLKQVNVCTKQIACRATVQIRKGSGNFPSLIEFEKKYKEDSFNYLISSGRRMMPAFKQLTNDEKGAIASFVLSIEKKQKQKFVEVPGPEDAYRKLPYSITGYNKFLSKEGYPAIAPPWGTLNAIDLNTGKWYGKIHWASYPEFAANGIRTGTENYGGSVITAGGLLFIGATSDGKFRVYNKRTGKLLLRNDIACFRFCNTCSVRTEWQTICCNCLWWREIRYDVR